MDKNVGWTLFLDRDGVINKRLKGDYVKTWEEFEFLPGALQALKLLADSFGKIIIVSNQQGIGKGLMTEEDLKAIHHKMLDAIEKAGGRIDDIFHCPDLAIKVHNCRKPSPVMALEARKKHPEIYFERSVMAGDAATDLEFGQNLGMKTVFIGNTNRYKMLKMPAHLQCRSLLEFAQHVEEVVD